MDYPDKETVIQAMLESARNAAERCSSDHPEDISYAMSAAVEGLAPVIMYLHKRGFLRQTNSA